MKKLSIVCLALVMALAFGFGNAYAQPSSKATAKVVDLTILEWQVSPVGPTAWSTIFSQNIKTPNQKDLFIDASLECGLYTRTPVKSKRNYEGDPGWDTSTAHAQIDVRVVIDEGTANERIASPGDVVFNSREQTLSAKFMGIFTGDCLLVTANPIQVDNDGDGFVNEDPVDGIDNDGDGLIDEDGIDYIITIDYGCLTYEELELILDTMSANSFNFVIDQLTPGEHTISVQARIEANGSAEEGEYEAKAMIGNGSVTIEVVRMIQGEDWLELPQ